MCTPPGIEKIALFVHQGTIILFPVSPRNCISEETYLSKQIFAEGHIVSQANVIDISMEASRLSPYY